MPLIRSACLAPAHAWAAPDSDDLQAVSDLIRNGAWSSNPHGADLSPEALAWLAPSQRSHQANEIPFGVWEELCFAAGLGVLSEIGVSPRLLTA